ncbi:MBL fold metallo-hydrolase [Saprospira sp. CCB-QB6]|uniref:MBL fold metallo-hydrolase n=1 Tax=Saprospira sp. CCB-QB6 TaxID=3023936 RepID=UPI00234AD19E|nr:MBL fold metallo-hydrolase [Saprospira sp. CCB-QB6]WCL82502.1 MBL fold metallo-hydrolase [Saprospira sp. CCB-QB6]
MKVEQLYTGCLAQGAYYIESEGEAAIIDPLRETAPYLEMAEERGAKIKYILETHFHADFVSGHIDLAKKSGAQIVFGPKAETGYDAYVAKDNEELKLGKLRIKVLHTPGHTQESSSFLLLDEEGEQLAIFTGDTLFIGDVGRPDLAIKSDVTMDDLAGMLYDSLHNKIMPLNDDLIVYPGHGAGSACGKNMSKETYATLGNQKEFNYALQPMSRQEFITKVTAGLATPPQYFGYNAMMNKAGYNSFDEALAQGTTPLDIEAFKAEMAKGTLILDTRHQDVFEKGYIPGAISIGLDGNFAPWVGAMIVNLQRPILLIVQEGREEEAVTRLARVGYDNVVGFLKGGLDAWTAAGEDVATVKTIPATELAQLIAKEDDLKVIDVRNEGEFISEHLLAATNYPLAEMAKQVEDLDKKATYYVHCAGGYRSMIASAVLQNMGFENIINVAGGFTAISETDAPKSDYVCPSTLL